MAGNVCQFCFLLRDQSQAQAQSATHVVGLGHVSVKQKIEKTIHSSIYLFTQTLSDNGGRFCLYLSF
jgi:hypothetical protein